ncbi:hypothetical protein ACHAXR_009316 [Thalassiosira sp. AJA248-18]
MNPTAGKHLHRLLAALAAVVIMMGLPSLSFSNVMHNPSYMSISQLRISPLSCRLQQNSHGENNDALRADKFSSLRSIGVDYGLTRTGIATTTGGYRPRPLTILSGLNSTELATAIVDYVVSERATNIVLGLPLHKNGTASEQSGITRMFGQYLLKEVRQRCGMTVELALWDERYTSKEAASRIAAEAMARNQRIPSASELGGDLDADAACIILEDYYKELGVDAEGVMLEDATVAEECDAIYRRNLERGERLRMEKAEERERGRNARREMIERDKALEEQQNGVMVVGAGGKRKKKKKKKKR